MRLNWEAAHASDYEIRVSDDALTWTTLVSVTGGGGAADVRHVSGSGRYVRMHGTSRATEYGYSLWDFEVYASAVPNNSEEVAEGQPTTASSVEVPSLGAANATDGDLTTRWSSVRTDPQWLQVDLGAVHQLSAVRLDWEAAHASDYEIRVSDDAVTWTTLVSVTGGGGAADVHHVSGSGRYVRMHGTSRATEYGYSLWNFEVYGANQAPVANAGTNQTVIENSTVTLNGTASSDAESGTPSSHSWSQQSGPNVQLDAGETIGAVTFTAPEVTEATELVFKLNVSDGVLEATDEVTVTVIPRMAAKAHRVPDSHDGSLFSFDLIFNKEPSLSYEHLRDSAFEVTGGTVERARRHTPGVNLSWTILVRPSGTTNVVLVLTGNRACDEEGATCTANGEQLSETLTVTVPSAAEPPPIATAPLTATAHRVPDSHDGSLFSFNLILNKEPSLSYEHLRDSAFEVTGGTVERARRHTPGVNLSWTILVRPSGTTNVVLVLTGNRACDEEGATCTANGEQLSETLTVTVPGSR